MKESKIEAEVCRYAREQHQFRTYKFTSPNHRSVPDRIFITPVGVIAFIEFKSATGELTPGQVRELQHLDEYMCDCFVVDDIEQGKQLVDLIADPEQYKAILADTRRTRLEGELRAAALIRSAPVSGSRH